MRAALVTREGAGSLRTVDFVVTALFNLGGKARSVDIEDIAMEAFRLAPHRFRWRKYETQVDLAQVRDGLSDARKPGNGELVAGNRKHGWTLTPAGVQLAERLSAGRAPEDKPQPMRERLDIPVLAAERRRVMTSRALAKAQAGASDQVTLQEIRELLRIDQYVTSKKYAQRVALVVNALSDEPEVLEIVEALERRYRGEMGR